MQSISRNVSIPTIGRDRIWKRVFSGRSPRTSERLAESPNFPAPWSFHPPPGIRRHRPLSRPGSLNATISRRSHQSEGRDRQGLARSVTGFSIHEGLKHCASHLLAYGGHRYAAGILIREKRSRVQPDPARTLRAAASVRRCRPVPSTSMPAASSGTSMNVCIADRQAGRLSARQIRSHFFAFRNVEVVSTSVVGNNHLRMRISAEGVSATPSVREGTPVSISLRSRPVDIVFTPRLAFPGADQSEVQLKVRRRAVVRSFLSIRLNSPSPAIGGTVRIRHRFFSRKQKTPGRICLPGVFRIGRCRRAGGYRHPRSGSRGLFSQPCSW